MKLHFLPVKLRTLNLTYIRRSWWKILLLGILLAVACQSVPLSLLCPGGLQR